MKRNWQRKLGLLLCVLLYTGTSSIGYCADAGSYKTQEYYASKGLEFIHAADAYALGYTGKGITLGICDYYVYLAHPEFNSKPYSGTINSVPRDYDWVHLTHGTHVGGIMAATKNDIGMHGVAFDANLLSGTFASDYSVAGTYDVFNKNSNVKIINNSWSRTGYIDDIGKDAVLHGIEDNADTLANSIINYDKVLVFAAGNDGHTSARAESLLPYLKPETAGNFINVVSIDPTKNTAEIDFLSIFSNLTKYQEENSIAAPGHYIYSSVPTSQYEEMPGTSMATPHVSGVAGLVQQAFPYMNGKQIVDTVLSTANSNFTLPTYTLTVHDGGSDKKINLYYFKTSSGTVQEDVQAYYDNNKAWIDEYYPGFIGYEVIPYYDVPQEMVFGQGLLDAGSAVRGPGILNARRMDSSNISSAYGSSQALYRVDTQGYNSIWSNNISEKMAGLLSADSKYDDLKAIYGYYMQGDNIHGFNWGQDYIDEYNARYGPGGQAYGVPDLHVGLIKSGQGTLTLTGANTYQGSSIAEGGVLQIDGSVAGDAWSVGTGTIAGKGTIAGNLTNQSIVRAGSDGGTGTFIPGTLHVDGNLMSTGKIAVAASSTGYGKLAVAGSADIGAGTTFMTVSGSIYQPDTTYRGVITAAAGITGSFHVTPTPFTGMLVAAGSVNGNSADLILTRANNMDNPTARQLQSYNRMERMYDNLQGQATQREMDLLYSLDSVRVKQALTAIHGGAQLNQAALTQADTTMDKAIAARFDHVKYCRSKGTTLTPGSLEANTIIPMEMGANNNWWTMLAKKWGSTNASDDMPGLDNQNFGVLMGRDQRISEDWRTGVVFGYGKNDVASSGAKSGNYGYRLGVYGGYNRESVDVQTYLEYGRQTNEATRYLLGGLSANSKYDSNTLGLGLKVRSNLQQNKEKVWRISPYANAHVTCYNQDGYAESGAGVLDQIADKFSNTYSTGEIGFEAGRDMHKGRCAVVLGYKKVLGGNNPDMAIAYKDNPDDKLSIIGNAQDGEYVVAGVHFQGELAENWTLVAHVDSEMGKGSRNLSAALMSRWAW